MRTSFRTPPELAEIFIKIAEAMPPFNCKRPERFISLMKSNTGVVGAISGNGLDEDGLEPKNPLIVAIGDSVTAGHFEFTEHFFEMIARLEANPPKDLSEFPKPDPARPIEITDARESYIEHFRNMLIDQFETTSVSVINAGIAGDSIFGMYARLERDVIRCQPDLVLINGSLNWNDAFGDADKFKQKLRQMIQDIKAKTSADIILLTPNMELPNPFKGISTLPQRVAAIRELADEEDVLLADTYAVWEEYARQGHPVEALLANGCNHPSITGHEVYAITLMKLMQ